MKLEPHGELWEVFGYGWRLPIRVKFIDAGTCEVRIADLPLLKKQREKLEGALENQCYARDGVVWFFHLDSLKKFAFPSRYEDPEDCVIWGSAPTNNVKPSDDFVDAYCASRDSAFRNAVQFRVVFAHICKSMMEWVLIQNRTLDLGFCRIDAFALRANWKNAMANTIIGKWCKGKLPTDTEEFRRVQKKLLHRDYLTSWDRETNTYRWTLEVMPLKPFHDTAEKIEIERKSKSKEMYELDVLVWQKNPRQKDRAMEYMAAYWREAARPYGKLPHGHEHRFKGDGEGPIAATPAAEKRHSTPVVIGAKLENGDGCAVVPEDAGVPTLSALQSLPENVWDGGENVGGANGNEANPGGLPLLASEKESDGGELLPIPENGGVAGVGSVAQQLPDNPDNLGVQA